MTSTRTGVAATRRQVVIAGEAQNLATLRALISATGSTVSLAVPWQDGFAVELPADVPCDLVVLSVSTASQNDLPRATKPLLDRRLPVLAVATDPSFVLRAGARVQGIDQVLVTPVSVPQMATSIEIAVQRVRRASASSGVHAIDLDAVAPSEPDLSAREREVFTLLTDGLRANDIAKTLFISRHTARNHIKTVFRKLGVHSQVELMRRCTGGEGA